MTANASAFFYLASAICFILALKGLSSPATARSGNLFGVTGMVIAISTTLLQPHISGFVLIAIAMIVGAGIGTVIAMRIRMTAMPQLVAAFHSLVGLAAVLVATAALYAPDAYGIGTVGNISATSLIEISLGAVIGAITFTGSIIAFGKLQSLIGGAPVVFPGQHLLNLAIGFATIGLILWFCFSENYVLFWGITALALLLGILIIIPIGGADMPVVVSMLNSYSGWAAAGIGFTLQNQALIIVGALVGSSGAILSYIMCKAMNRSFFNVLLGGFGTANNVDAIEHGEKSATAGSAGDAAFIMKNAQTVIIVPGYGMAVAQAQHSLREMADILKQQGVDIRYAIHPVAGRMPGHMNVLLAEADVPYDEVFELEEINNDFASCDVAFVIGANDVTNPAAKKDPSSPIAGMPILDVDKSHAVLFVKRSLSPGYAGIDNEVFYGDKTMMLFGDAKKMVGDIIKVL
ncbi:MAG: NAD(P) transhydrogenase subunit beta [Alphaproteobacteria bacterium MarineAlpha9_Bin7]|nr:MAG: NAD(P) transhydrogenase subunit beta [Alphaproteobacteria bacterium MarineAlpha9_Bin7]